MVAPQNDPLMFFFPEPLPSISDLEVALGVGPVGPRAEDRLNN